jgi:cellulose synthase/poly-beta-1,6-N-acetylglucosamine synthase-like glycosyltransferase
MYIILRILEKIFIIYFVAYMLIDIGLFLYSFFVFRKRKNTKPSDIKADWREHPVSVIVPAYNEEVSIAYCAEMLLQLNYPAYELIIVNDGSLDNTLLRLKEHFVLKEERFDYQKTLATRPVRHIYRAEGSPLTVVDKENGGKADSLNAAINIASGRYICTIDADSILDNNALEVVVAPFVRDASTMVTGGQLAASNDVVLKNNKVVSSRMPGNIWVLWQILEYIKSFLVSRIGLSKINALMLMSGAFSTYRRDELLKIGGFLSPENVHPYIAETIGKGKQTVCEDMEIVVRLFKFRADNHQKAKATFLPGPVCWTEVPEKGISLFKQRARWHQGLIESLYIHRAMIFEPKYKAAGLLGLPYYFFFEMLAPVIKVLAIIFIIILIRTGMVNLLWISLILVGAILLTAIITTSITAIIEFWSRNQPHTNRDALRYKGFKDWMILIFAGIAGEFSYSFYKLIAQLKGFINFFGKKSDWKKFERKGVKKA